MWVGRPKSFKHFELGQEQVHFALLVILEIILRLLLVVFERLLPLAFFPTITISLLVVAHNPWTFSCLIILLVWFNLFPRILSSAQYKFPPAFIGYVPPRLIPTPHYEPEN